MRLFPFRQPSLGLSIGDGTLGLVELRRGWRKPVLRRCTDRALPAGLLRLSASDSNVTDVPALAREFSALLDAQGKVTRPVPIALSLPDLCARVALFEFDSLPRKPSELEALVRWRFQKDLNLSVTDARVTYQVFQPGSARASVDGPIRALAVSIRPSVIEPYEQACESAGLIPVDVGLTSLQLFDLCRPSMEAALKTAGECFFLYVEEGSFAFIAVRAGLPVFLRIKPLRVSARPSPQRGDGEVEGDAVRDELLATLQFYMEHEAASGNAPTSSRPLFLANGRGLAPALPDSLRITVTSIDWENFRVARQSSVVPSPAGLPAYAGVVET